jgi:serine/threonine-protein kinase
MVTRSSLERVSYTDPCDPAARIGEELSSKWRLTRVLGVGGTAVVYEAVHRNGRRAAVKLLASCAARSPALARELAQLESRLANVVDDPGVVAVLDDDVAADGTPYLVMELLAGETLDELRCAFGGRIPLDHALPIFASLLEVLGALHRHGIVHRDVKPENVFVLRSGGVKILDLGLAADRRMEPDRSPWFGTPGFMAPEQARAEWRDVDALSDIWAAAATMFTVLTGELVHPGTSAAALVRAAARDEVDLGALARAGLPAAVIDVLGRALAFDRQDRWPSAGAMLAALRAAAIAPPPAKVAPLRAAGRSGMFPRLVSVDSMSSAMSTAMPPTRRAG